MRRRDPIVLMASGNCDGFPSTVGFSKSSAFPPPGDFISRFAHSAMSRSVSTGTTTRVSSPAFSSASMNCRKEPYAIEAASRFRVSTTRPSFEQKQLVTPRRAQDLDRNHAAVGKRDRLRRISHSRRNIRVEKWIEERIANYGEPVPVMVMKYDRAAEVPAIAVRAVRIRIGRVGVGVLIVDPRFHGTPPCAAGRLLVRRAPRQPDRVLRHAFANLSLPDQLLVLRR